MNASAIRQREIDGLQLYVHDSDCEKFACGHHTVASSPFSRGAPTGLVFNIAQAQSAFQM
jgi:hypothetical protein